MKAKWILSGAMAFGLAGIAVPTVFSADRPRESRAQRERNRDYDEQIKYAELPRPVKATVDHERRNHEVKSFWHVMREGKEFYRAVIDTKGDDTVIRIKPGGELLTEQEARDMSEGMVLKGEKRNVVLHQGESDGALVDFERLPGQVKAEIGRLAKGDNVVEVVRYRHNGRVMYRAEVGHDRFTRYIRVNENGDLANVRGDVDPGEPIAWDRTPGPVKAKIGALAKSGRVDEVIVYKRGGKSYYQAEVDDRNSKKNFFYTVDGEGHEVDRLPRE